MTSIAPLLVSLHDEQGDQLLVKPCMVTLNVLGGLVEPYGATLWNFPLEFYIDSTQSSSDLCGPPYCFMIFTFGWS